MDVPAFVKVASNPARVVGLNTIGMDRGGISIDTIQKLKDAYSASLIERVYLSKRQLKQLSHGSFQQQ